MVPIQLLLVEDDAAITRLLVTVLRRHGFEVDVARDGVAGMSKLRSGDYAGVLLDLMLPAMSGFEVVRELSSSAPALLKRTIIITAASQATLRDFDRSQVFSVVRKPFDLDDLMSQVSACVSRAAVVPVA